MTPTRLTLGLAVAASILAVSTAAILIVESDAPPLAIAFHRLLYATLVLAPIAWWKARDELRALPARDLGLLVLVGAVLGVHFAAWIASLDLTSIASSVVLVTLHPVFVALVSHRVFGEGPTRLGYAGIAVALVGGVLITWGDAQVGASPLVGDALALVGAAAAAAYFLAGRGFRRRLSLLAYVTPVYASAAVVLGLMLVTVPEPWGGPLLGYPLREHLLFAALALVPMLLGHTVLNWALKWLPAPVVATSILGEPVGSSLLAFAAFGMVPAPLTLIGGAVVLAGIGTVVLSDAMRARSSA